MPTLFVLMSVYNEAPTIVRAIERFDEHPVPDGVERRIISVDDGSTDGSRDIIDQLLQSREDLHVILHERNRGKGAAVRSAIEHAIKQSTDDADVLLIHDADLEYSPADHARVLAPILDGGADAVIGSRFLGEAHRVLYFWHRVANGAITLLSNVFTNLNLSDVECCTKAFTCGVAKELELRENGFGIEPELVARLSQTRIDGRPLRIFEVGVSYAGRTYAEGKKIGWRDGVEAIGVILRCALRRP
ncbi:MAG: glycosyltransferase family 2 protein [Planctomycetota bacterium]